ncbi:MAG TPA: hypothetical protein VNX47_04530 [Nevskia sp.]|nr:hypothetical protein [Nevskia sp.]
MLKTTVTACTLSIIAGAAWAAGQSTASPYDAGVEDLTLRGAPPMLGMHLPRDLAGAGLEREEAAAQLSGRRSANMTYHGGKILPTVVSKAIFWGPSWANSSFAGDKITGLDSWYTGHDGSNYAKTVDEYTGSNGRVGPSGFVHQGHVVDTSTASGGGNTTTILNEVCKQVTAGNIVPDAGGDGYYPVYTDVKRGNAGYCAWHSYGSCGGKPVQIAFFFNLDGDSGCDPQDSSSGHSQGLAALANVTGHELSEARSDPASPGAWYDSAGNENGDKCAWTFGAPLVTFTNGTQWKIQGEWSNAAYTAGTGYPNSSGQKGCLSGL